MSDPYAAIAAFYDAEYATSTSDAHFFARNASTGSLLVLGCGTGRVASILSGTRGVTGLDLSEPMLARARARRGDSTRYVLGDMRDFNLGIFGEIVIPNGAFCFLGTRGAQLSCLESCARALPSGGHLTIDLPAPEVRLLGVPHTPERMVWEGTLDERPAHRTREVWRRALLGQLDLFDRYFVDGELVATSMLALQLVFPREAEWLCEAAGFWVDRMSGDYGGGPLRDGADRIIVKAIRC